MILSKNDRDKDHSGRHVKTKNGYVRKDGHERVRVSIFLSERQKELLKARAAAEKKCVSDYICDFLGL